MPLSQLWKESTWLSINYSDWLFRNKKWPALSHYFRFFPENLRKCTHKKYSNQPFFDLFFDNFFNYQTVTISKKFANLQQFFLQTQVCEKHCFYWFCICIIIKPICQRTNVWNSRIFANLRAWTGVHKFCENFVPVQK